MTVSGKQHFGRFHEEVRQFDVTGKTLLVPEMAPFASRLLAASFHAVGVNALLLETKPSPSASKPSPEPPRCHIVAVATASMSHRGGQSEHAAPMGRDG